MYAILLSVVVIIVAIICLFFVLGMIGMIAQALCGIGQEVSTNVFNKAGVNLLIYTLVLGAVGYYIGHLYSTGWSLFGIALGCLFALRLHIK